MSGQFWQDSWPTTASRKSKCIIADFCVLPRISPRLHTHDVLNRRILDLYFACADRASRSLYNNPTQSPPRSSTGNKGKFFNCVSHLYPFKNCSQFQLKLHITTPTPSLRRRSLHFLEEKSGEDRKLFGNTTIPNLKLS